MNRKQRFAFKSARVTRALGIAFKNVSKDAVSGAALLGKIAVHTTKDVGRSAKNAVADVRQGAKYGWASVQDPRTQD